MKRSKKVSTRILAVAAAGYRLAAELDNPVTDYVMRRIRRIQLDDTVNALTYDERLYLSTWEK